MKANTKLLVDELNRAFGPPFSQGGNSEDPEHPRVPGMRGKREGGFFDGDLSGGEDHCTDPATPASGGVGGP